MGRRADHKDPAKHTENQCIFPPGSLPLKPKSLHLEEKLSDFPQTAIGPRGCSLGAGPTPGGQLVAFPTGSHLEPSPLASVKWFCS